MRFELGKRYGFGQKKSQVISFDHSEIAGHSEQRRGNLLILLWNFER